MLKFKLAASLVLWSIVSIPGVPAAQDVPIVIVADKEWVCYYDRRTYELLYCQWE